MRCERMRMCFWGCKTKFLCARTPRTFEPGMAASQSRLVIAIKIV